MNQERPLVWAFTSQELGAALRRYRKDSALSQDGLAERLGVSRMTVSRLERGDAVSLDTAVAALSECGAKLAVVPKSARIRMVP